MRMTSASVRKKREMFETLAQSFESFFRTVEVLSVNVLKA
jgi:hypothetical protein